MAKNLNQVQLMGNLTRDPELKSANGTPVVNFSLALNRSYKDNSGEWQEATDFVDVVAWGKTAEQVAEVVTKGSRVLVVGRIQSRTYEQEGQKRSKTEVLAMDVTFIGKSETQYKDTILTDIDEGTPVDLSSIPDFN